VDNPAIIQVGDAYNDLGATITGPQQDLNLGIKTYLNGTLTSNIVIDTSAAATDTIDSVATDSSATPLAAPALSSSRTALQPFRLDSGSKIAIFALIVKHVGGLRSCATTVIGGHRAYVSNRHSNYHRHRCDLVLGHR
jgi:hypothetical protein